MEVEEPRLDINFIFSLFTLEGFVSCSNTHSNLHPEQSSYWEAVTASTEILLTVRVLVTQHCVSAVNFHLCLGLKSCKGEHKQNNQMGI